MTAIERYEPPTNPAGGWVELLAPAADLSRQIANTEFVPSSLRGNPAKVTACILFGAELGIGPMQALAKVDVIDGRPAPKAELARALILGAGHRIWIEEQTNTKVTVAGQRRGDDIIQRVTWTMDDAKRAGLEGKQNWRKWPRQMLHARASAELARAVFPDCLGGIGYFAEEVDDGATTTDTAEAPVIAVAAPNGRARKLTAPGARQTPTAPALAPAPPIAEDLPPLPDELPIDEPLHADELITDAQVKKLATMFGKLGVTDRTETLQICVQVVGHELASKKDLTKVEASAVIERLTDVEENCAEFIIDDGIPYIVNIEEGVA